MAKSTSQEANNKLKSQMKSKVEEADNNAATLASKLEDQSNDTFEEEKEAKLKEYA